MQSTHDTLAEADEQAVQNRVEGASRDYSHLPSGHHQADLAQLVYAPLNLGCGGG